MLLEPKLVKNQMELGNFVEEIWIQSCKLLQNKLSDNVRKFITTVQSSHEKNIWFDCKRLLDFGLVECKYIHGD